MPEGDVRERLLDVATELFARKGYAASTTREIVAAARVTKPVLYYYFKSKEGIYLELLERAFKRFEAVVDASITGSGSIEQRLRRLCDQVFGLVVEKIEVVRLMYSIYYGPPRERLTLILMPFTASFLKLSNRLFRRGFKARSCGRVMRRISPGPFLEPFMSPWKMSCPTRNGSSGMRD